MFKGRSVIEIMVLVFTLVVAFAICGLGVLVLLVESRHPEADTGVISNTLSTLVSGILGALLGVLAGRSGNLKQPPDKEP